jgi:hypothetical protein
MDGDFVMRSQEGWTKLAQAQYEQTLLAMSGVKRET